MAKKSFLERLKLVESSEPEFDMEAVKSQLSSYDLETTEPEFDLGGEDFLTVEEVYAKANLQDMSKSIFKVDEFSKVLPGNLPTDVKRQSVIGILTASGLDVDTLTADADQRLAALNGVAATTAQNTVDLITEKETKIAQLLEEVDLMKQEINDRKKSQEVQNKLVDDEKAKINEIVNFVSSK